MPFEKVEYTSYKKGIDSATSHLHHHQKENSLIYILTKEILHFFAQRGLPNSFEEMNLSF